MKRKELDAVLFVKASITISVPLVRYDLPSKLGLSVHGSRCRAFRIADVISLERKPGGWVQSKSFGVGWDILAHFPQS